MQPDPPSLKKPITPAHVPVTLAEQKHLVFLIHLQKQFGEAVGFMPVTAIQEAIEKRHVHLAWENDQPAGYVIHRPHLRWRPELSTIVQMCVELDAQRRHIGMALLKEICRPIEDGERAGVQANCAVGVPSNEFWSAVGFVPICHFTPGNKRNRELICWRLPLVKRIPTWFAQPPEVAGFPPKKVHLVRNPNRKELAHEIASRYITRRQTPRPTNRAIPPQIRPPDDLEI